MRDFIFLLTTTVDIPGAESAANRPHEYWLVWVMIGAILICIQSLFRRESSKDKSTSQREQQLLEWMERQQNNAMDFHRATAREFTTAVERMGDDCHAQHVQLFAQMRDNQTEKENELADVVRTCTEAINTNSNHLAASEALMRDIKHELRERRAQS